MTGSTLLSMRNSRGYQVVGGAGLNIRAPTATQIETLSDESGEKDNELPDPDGWKISFVNICLGS